MGAGEKSYNLEERTAKFGEDVLDFIRKLPHDRAMDTLVRQIVRSATSVGANYCEANDAFTRKDFLHKISISRKESKESKHWLRMIARAAPEFAGISRVLWQEAYELNLIFSAILRTGRNG
ncbi:four helix bundle protein [bacterium]|nr:four helix bundle protein [bacterium]|tara:strand:- start:566 stop:928 length:363 start_codon:yes stop_codon:yes gene_type:complete